MFCALGCSAIKKLYLFPSRKYDNKRRKFWLNFFDMEEPNIDHVYACQRHFSSMQTTPTGIQKAAVPDIPVTCIEAVPPFKRKTKNWRKNVVVVTPTDPEYVIYRNETGVFPQNLFNNQPVIKMPKITSVSCSMATQTNTHFCGLVQITGTEEEYRLNCFHCSKTFAIENWPEFVNHTRKYFQKEIKHVGLDHDYAYINSHKVPSIKPPDKVTKVNNSFFKFPSYNNLPLNTTMLPSLLPKPQNCINILPPPLLAKPHQSNDKSFTISLADQLIKLLNDTILSPNFLNTEDDNILIIKNSASNSCETSSFLKDLLNPETSFTPAPQPGFNIEPRNTTASNTSSKYTRPVYSIKYGQKNIPSRKRLLSFLPPLPKNKMARLVQKRIAQQTLKTINVFENVYNTVKKRYPEVSDPENISLTDPNSGNLTEGQTSNITPLSRCLKRTITETNETLPRKQKTTEIVFEYTPRDIIVSLLESMKNYPVLWEFHEQPFNQDYNKSIAQLCLSINGKWSLNITALKMRRSINRILRFYRCMLPRESIDKFEDYFDKCALFLPSVPNEIPMARCCYCCVCFKKDGELRKHIIQKHKCLKWPYKCPSCYERFRESDEYELHKRLPHYGEIFKCERCDKRFNRRHLYNKHVNSHKRAEMHREASNQSSQNTKPTHECNVCHRLYMTLKQLNQHKKYHEKHKCHICLKEVCSKNSLHTHLKRHRKEVDFVCEVCGKGFVKKSCLNVHMEVHRNIQIACKICNLKLRKQNLLRHLRLVHVATEGTIESTFRSIRNFMLPRKRIRTREGTPRQYNCKICNILFDRLKFLKDHNKQMHADVKTTPCQMCFTEFKHITNLRRHYRFKHKLQMYQIFKLIYEKEDLSTVLDMKMTDLEYMEKSQHNTVKTYSANNEDNENKLSHLEDDNYFDQEINTDHIQSEIMKAVENLDKQDMKVDDEQSMNTFFTDLLKHP